MNYDRVTVWERFMRGAPVNKSIRHDITPQRGEPPAATYASGRKR